ncbi:MAG: ATP-binding protein [Magnetococcales bacterium]|nr:ATP-binding protein [Magnetococcales bacterium]
MAQQRTWTEFFTVDSALLKELGERLVGKPYIALAELVKNAYDADATLCEIRFVPDGIEIVDNGHGMTADEFRNFWMRIGTTHKQREGYSRLLSRPVTGSKGVGRLAVQFLADQLTITTTPRNGAEHALTASINWQEAVSAGELTKATASCKTHKIGALYADGCSHGTRIVLKSKNQQWSTEEIDNLSKELWMLQPPFLLKSLSGDADCNFFRMKLFSEEREFEDIFREGLKQAIENWETKITGKLIDARNSNDAEIKIEVIFRDNEIFRESVRLENPLVNRVDFEIRVFRLTGRQAGGIAVNDLRQYIMKFGGIHIFDAGFRLPYYGLEQDWLGIEADHSHRKHVSELLPKHLHEAPRSLNDLPTLQRVFGMVFINTGQEKKIASDADEDDEEHLKVQISRDRFVDNRAYRELKRIVRWSVDYYATRVALRKFRQTERTRPVEPAVKKLDRIQSALDAYREEMSEQVYDELRQEIHEFTETAQKESEAVESETSLLAPLAAAGMAALALEHETARELRRLRGIARSVAALSIDDPALGDRIQALADSLDEWVNRFEAGRKIFSPLVNREDRETTQKFNLKRTLRSVAKSIAPFCRGAQFLFDVPDDLRLPAGTQAEWQAIFQNVFVNAANAMLDSDKRVIHCHATVKGNRQVRLRVMDTGNGIDLKRADAFFEPFQRESRISEERRSLGLGGMGLGLTIVRMIAVRKKCTVGFEEPPHPYATAFTMSWRE